MNQELFKQSVNNWKQIPGYRYLISDCGRVYSLIGKGRELKPGLDKDGYCVVSLHKDRVGKQFKVHRLVLSVFGEVENTNLEVNHINGVRSDNRICNLEWCTHGDNIRHSVRIGLKGGIGNRLSKKRQLKVDQEIKVLSLIEAYARGDDLRVLQKNFKLPLKTIQQIVAEKYYPTKKEA